MNPNEDFQKLIKDLRKCGWTYPKLGEAIGKNDNTVRNIARGRTMMPRYDVGVRLVAIHREEFPFG